jgi:hypothetical protein
MPKKVIQIFGIVIFLTQLRVPNVGTKGNDKKSEVKTCKFQLIDKKGMKKRDNCLQKPPTPKKTVENIIDKSKYDDTAEVIAAIHNVSSRYVRMVMEGERNNREILISTVEYRQAKKELIRTIQSYVPVN